MAEPMAGYLRVTPEGGTKVEPYAVPKVGVMTVSQSTALQLEGVESLFRLEDGSGFLLVG